MNRPQGFETRTDEGSGWVALRRRSVSSWSHDLTTLTLPSCSDPVTHLECYDGTGIKRTAIIMLLKPYKPEFSHV